MKGTEKEMLKDITQKNRKTKEMNIRDKRIERLKEFTQRSRKRKEMNITGKNMLQKARVLSLSFQEAIKILNLSAYVIKFMG